MASLFNLTLITGPSGVGKGTLVKKLLERNEDLWLSISATTREPRKGEKNGEHYYFLNKSRFEELIAEGGFLEWAEFAGNLYGTPIAQVQNQLDNGKRVLLEIELEGARQVRKSSPESFQIFIAPPNFDELEKRIRSRGMDKEDSIQKRLKQASKELEAKSEFDAVVINEDLDKALFEIENLLELN